MTDAAAAPAHVFDVDQQSFEADVLQASLTTPILVDFWATWCEPCKILGPMLEKLAAEYNGAFRLAKVDVDKSQQLAGMFGIRSIPTVMLVKDGQILDGFAGALPEGQLREFLNRHVQPLDGAVVEGDAPAEAPESPEEAINRIQQAIAAEPDAAELKLDLALALMRAGQAADADAELTSLPANLATDAPYACAASSTSPAPSRAPRPCRNCSSACKPMATTGPRATCSVCACCWKMMRPQAWISSWLSWSAPATGMRARPRSACWPPLPRWTMQSWWGVIGDGWRRWCFELTGLAALDAMGIGPSRPYVPEASCAARRR